MVCWASVTIQATAGLAGSRAGPGATAVAAYSPPASISALSRPAATKSQPIECTIRRVAMSQPTAE